jgi:uncharacterized protein (DUF433 family)
MPQNLAVEAVPLIAGSDGEMLVEGTRVPLEAVIAAFEDGATPEEIAQQYPTVSLGVVYQLVGYYLRHRQELEPYIVERTRRNASTRAANELRWPSDGIRDRLLERRK